MDTATKAAGIDAIYFPVKDVQRSIAFYRDTVGAEPSNVSEEWGAEYDLPEGAGWGFGPASLFDGKTAPATVFFAIPDVRAAIERLKATGKYEVGDPMDSPVCTMAFVSDGDGGNTLCLHQRKPSAS
ncbi:MAG TPA: VOC family protein [Candidatus Tumulicola sp.]